MRNSLLTSPLGLTEEMTYSYHNKMCPWREHSRIDFIFSIPEFLQGKFARVNVTEWNIIKYKDGEELSDHYAQSVKLQIMWSRAALAELEQGLRWAEGASFAASIEYE